MRVTLRGKNLGLEEINIYLKEHLYHQSSNQTLAHQVQRSPEMQLQPNQGAKRRPIDEMIYGL